jgi:hypothetical protein
MNPKNGSEKIDKKLFARYNIKGFVTKEENSI